MATPQAAVAMVTGATFTAVSYKVPNVRCILWIFSAIVGMIGAVMVHILDVETNRNASLAGVYLMGFYNVPRVFMLSMSSSNVAGATKKSLWAFQSQSSTVSPFIHNREACRITDSNMFSGRKHHRTSILPPATSTALFPWNRRDAYRFCRHGSVRAGIPRVLLL